MEKQLLKFQFNGTGSVRIIDQGEGNFLWHGKDICDILEYEDHSRALARLDEDEKEVINLRDFLATSLRDTQSIMGNPNNTFINESGVYSLIIGSQKPIAKEFKKWLTSEVLPSIRKHGHYKAENMQTVIRNTQRFSELCREEKDLKARMKEINAEKATILKTNETIAENISSGQLPMFLTQSSDNHLSVA